MVENNEEKIKEFIDKLDNKDFGIYFFTLDTKGNPTAGIANIYEHVKVLNELGYKAYILHEKNDYHGVKEWLGEEYLSLPHISIEEQKLNVGSSDFIIIPEVFSNVMEQTKNFPCKRIVLTQSYDYILELLGLGLTWSQYGIKDAITTNKNISNYIKSLMPSISTYEIPVSIPDYFKPSDKPKKLIVSILSREQRDTLKIVKAFYLKYPTYKWVTFRELRGIAKKTFAKILGESCLAVWIDPISGFGTFPLEAMECETPVIGLVPNMIPEWMEDSTIENSTIQLKNNGIWTNNILNMPDMIASFLKMELEDSVPEELTNNMKISKGHYTEEKQKEVIKEIYSKLIDNRKQDFEKMLIEMKPKLEIVK